MQFVTSEEADNKSQLGVFEHLLVLMRLRLNLQQEDLAYRFGISQSMVSKLFNKWIVIIAQRLQPLIWWPNKTDLKHLYHMHSDISLRNVHALLIAQIYT